jgi:RHS repeat-associated protein
MMKAGGSKYYYASNHLYSVAALTDSTGAVVERYKYDAYGRQGIMNQNGTVSYSPSDYGNFIGFTGRYHDWETGLTYFRTRYEDPQLGRFLNRMPWFGMEGLELSNYATLEMSPEWRSFMHGVLRDAAGSYIQGRMGLYDFMLQDPANTVEPFSGVGTLTGAGIGTFGGPGGTIVGGVVGAIVDAGGYIIVGAAAFGAGAVGIAAGAGSYTPDGVGWNKDTGPSYPPFNPQTCNMAKTKKPPRDAADPNGSKAPGLPASNDGYNPPPGGAQWGQSPNGNGWGWVDKDGNVWVPTGQGSAAHGGPHWDVQQQGGGYQNVYPGGNVR